MARAQHRTMARAVAWSAPAYSRISQVASTAAKAIRLPTDRSIPPAMMTSVMPIARIARMLIWWAMFNRLLSVRKGGQE